MAQKPPAAPQLSYQFRVVGAPRLGWADAYHAFLRMPWRWALALLVAVYLGVNLIFALFYWGEGGVAYAHPGSFKDAFFFSIQTMGTIGYGRMYPESDMANALVVAESVVSLLITALAAGLMFA